MSKSKTMVLKGIFDQLLTITKQKQETVKPYAQMTDEEVIISVQAGEEHAYQYIIQRYQGKIFAYIMRLINHRDEAHDITQTVFLKAYKNLHSFDTERKFSSWVYRIAHNESVNWLKKKTRIKMESLENKVEQGLQFSESTDIHESVMKKEEAKKVRNAIDSLPEKYKEVMEMRYLQQKSYQEISDILQKPVNTIGTLINRAKKRLQDSLTL